MKNINKYSLLLILTFIPMIVFAQQKSRNYLDYPIEYTQISGVFKGKPTPRMLFYTPGNLVNITNENGITLICRIDKKTRKNNGETYYLSLNQGKKKILLFQISLQINDDEECSYMTYFKVKNVESGLISEFSYDADDTVTSFGRIMGGFSGTAQYMFNIDQLNKSFEDKSDSNTTNKSLSE